MAAAAAMFSMPPPPESPTPPIRPPSVPPPCSHPHPTSATLKLIQSSGVIACLRADSCEQAMQAAEAALEGGVSVLEVMMSTPGVFEVVQRLVHNHPTSTIGVGTVLNVEDAKSATEAGAKFLMSPATVVEILDYALSSSVLYIPGVMTPTEAVNALNLGAKILKVYPVSILGGPCYISAIKKSFLHLPVVASQGITMNSLQKYLDAGASAVTLSDAIFEKEAMSARNFAAIKQFAQLATLLSQHALRYDRSTMSLYTADLGLAEQQVKLLAPHRTSVSVIGHDSNAHHECDGDRLVKEVWKIAV